MRLKLALIPSAQQIPNSESGFKKLPKITWAQTKGGQETSTKYFDDGASTRWECYKRGGLSWDDVWGKDADEGFNMQVQEKNETWFISYLDLDSSRQFRTFNSLGFQLDQTGGTKGSIYLYHVGREYKQPGTNNKWSYSDDNLGKDFYNKRGTFYHYTDFNSSEISKQQDGYILNRIYFNYGTTSSGQSVTGGGPHTECYIYNMKLGWGSGAASNSHRICLPKIRPFDQALQLQFG